MRTLVLTVVVLVLCKVSPVEADRVKWTAKQGGKAMTTITKWLLFREGLRGQKLTLLLL